LYRSAFENGTYQPAAPLPFSDGTTSDVDPEIAPDQSFIIFASAGRSAPNDPHEHLFMSVKHGDAWGPVTVVHFPGSDALGVDDNEPRLGPPNGRLLYFASNRSVLVMFPRTQAQAQADLQRLNAWDNGNTNVWFMPSSVPRS
jgi:hypothetical protein